jgi:hypothetical protein
MDAQDDRWIAAMASALLAAEYESRSARVIPLQGAGEVR